MLRITNTYLFLSIRIFNQYGGSRPKTKLSGLGCPFRRGFGSRSYSPFFSENSKANETRILFTTVNKNGKIFNHGPVKYDTLK